MSLPGHAQIVIVGGGIAGCSTAYHLAKLGRTDVLLLEQGKLTSGTTWHAAGLVGQMRPNRNMTVMSKYGIELYATLEAETGLATGWKQCGSVNVARTPERMKVLKKQVAMAHSFGVECHEISPRRGGRRYPVMRTDDLQGAIWLPGDGKANPADLCMSLAKGARNRGVKMVKASRSPASSSKAARLWGVRTRQGDVRCEVLVNCAGQWARQFGALAGVNVPLYSAEHFYIVTGKIDGVHPMLPVMRDPDGFIYYKEEVGGLVMGGFEPKAKPWKMDPIPSTFQFELLDEDWDQFEPLMTNAMHRTPCLETAEIKMLLNGPESFTPDGNFILGEAPELRNYFVCAGFNSAGIANSGGAGRLMAEWIVGGEPSTDLWDVDIRRFGAFTGNRKALAASAPAKPWACTTPCAGRARSWRQPGPCAHRRCTIFWQGRAEFGSKNGWERANYFKPHGRRPPATRWASSGLAALDDRGTKATREAVALYDQTSFSKLAAAGPRRTGGAATPVRQRDGRARDKMVYTAMLNERGGIESDLTVMRQATRPHGRPFLIITGSAQTVRDFDWISRHIKPDDHAVLTDVSALYSVLSVMGPEGARAAGPCQPDDLSPEGAEVLMDQRD
jgi:glycine/D-amino acid oxidase-like deaminating enzyme